jgi:type IV secretory pathway TrbL component
MLAGLTCPIGIPGVASKLPAAIAIAIAAQLLQKLDAAPAPLSAAKSAQSASTSSPSAAPAVRSAASAALSASAPAQIPGDGPQPCNAACDSCGSGRPNKA